MSEASEYHFTNALHCSMAQLSEMHTKSFEGYFMPAAMTPEETADFWRAFQIDATRCVITREKREFVGMARMGTRDNRGWCGGFGIAPEYRGRGAANLLAAEMVRVGRASGLELIQLEVLTQNERA